MEFKKGTRVQITKNRDPNLNCNGKAGKVDVAVDGWLFITCDDGQRVVVTQWEVILVLPPSQK